MKVIITCAALMSFSSLVALQAANGVPNLVLKGAYQTRHTSTEFAGEFR